MDMKVEQKTAVLLINLGTPDSPSTGDVRTYLSEFLNDGRVIDIPAVARLALVNGIIVPFRGPKSAATYKKIWTENGSPLLHYSNELRNLLEQRAGSSYKVFLAMRYGNPSLKTATDLIRKSGITRLVVLPLYPQYASSTTGSSLEKFFDCIRSWETMPEVQTIQAFYDHPAYLKALKETANDFEIDKYDHVLFSFHGVPERHIRKSDIANCCLRENCCDTLHAGNYLCYKAGCHQTAHALAGMLGLKRDFYTISFQSRLGKSPWIQPYSDKVIKKLAEEGKKKLLVFSPAFVADCLETIYEIGEEYDELFREHGGEKIQLVPSLNTSPAWVEALHTMISEKL